MVKKKRKGKRKKERSKKRSGPAHQHMSSSLSNPSCRPPQLSPKSLTPSLASLSPRPGWLGGGHGSQAAAPHETWPKGEAVLEGEDMAAWLGYGRVGGNFPWVWGKCRGAGEQAVASYSSPATGWSPARLLCSSRASTPSLCLFLPRASLFRFFPAKSPVFPHRPEQRPPRMAPATHNLAWIGHQSEDFWTPWS